MAALKKKPAKSAAPSNRMAEAAAAQGLTPEEYAKVLDILGREPNDTELGIFAVMWSEHCSYKTTRKHLAKLPTKAPHVICGPGENAGVIDIGDGQAAIFKMESHNHPSFIEPRQGAATGVGGILRDVFTMGARPIANMNSLRFGDVKHKKTKHLLAGVTSGIGFYGNCVGVPTVGGECTFHESYNGNNLVNAMTVGIANSDKIFYSKAAGVGNPVVYVGSKTGRDGIHGATMASAEFDDTIEEKRPTVQVGDPFTEKLLIEACLELMATDAIIAIQDMGAAGLTCSSLEMAGKGDLGIELWLEKVPQREENMTPFEMMLSESQERMLMVLKPESEKMARGIFEKWGLDYATIGTLTTTGRLVMKFHGETVGDIPVAPLSEQAPIYDRPYKEPVKRKFFKPLDIKLTRRDIGRDLLAMLGTPDLCSKRWIWRQYDHMVMNDTIARPGGDAAVVRVHGTPKALAISTDCTPRYVFSDPEVGGMQAVAECWRNLTATGAIPLAITNCLNFANPERPEVMGQLVYALEGMKKACVALDFPVVSGNVSLYNETKGKGIFPTPAIGGVGIIKDVNQTMGMGFASDGHLIAIIGETTGWLSCSLYAREMFNEEKNAPPPVDLMKEREHGDFVRGLIESHRITSCHDLSDGGLLVALAEMAMAGKIGAEVHFPETMPTAAYAFGEDQARYVIAFSSEHRENIEQEAATRDIPLTLIGKTGGTALNLVNQFSISVAELERTHEAFLPDYMGSNKA